MDHREFCAPIDDQQQLDAASAHACIGIVQYFERRATGRLVKPSRLFLYQAASRLLNQSPSSGTDLRTTLKALVRFGLPPEPCWPYDASRLGETPDAFLVGFARDFETMRYLRLDGDGQSGDSVLENVLTFLAAGYACVLGFTVFNSLSADADIPFPTMVDSARTGHAVAAVGYDDKHRFRSDKGALLVRNSWGTGWGDGGYGWLPYSYVRNRLALDFWTLLKPQWIESREFDVVG